MEYRQIRANPRDERAAAGYVECKGAACTRARKWAGCDGRWEEICADRFRIEIKIGFREKNRHFTLARALLMSLAIERSRI